MGSILANLFGKGLDIPGIINAIRGRNPEDAAKLQELLTRHEDLLVQTAADIEKAKIQANVDLNKTAAGNIQAEASSGTKFVSWARPSVVWMGNVLLLWNYAVVPMAGLHWHLQPVTLPEMFWWTWGTVVTGYVFARTGQEVLTKTVGGAGGTAQLPFGVKIDSKGD